MKKEKNKKNVSHEELSIPELNAEEIILFDKTDKPFLILYLFIFIMGIILTIISI
ncbi:MAG: hypothetical protein PHD33_03960 [Atribacterota bacterium]|nr:hypothetical protein [Atribacterota bacterium]